MNLFGEHGGWFTTNSGFESDEQREAFFGHFGKEYEKASSAKSSKKSSSKAEPKTSPKPSTPKATSSEGKSSGGSSTVDHAVHVYQNAGKHDSGISKDDIYDAVEALGKGSKADVDAAAKKMGFLSAGSKTATLKSIQDYMTSRHGSLLRAAASGHMKEKLHPNATKSTRAPAFNTRQSEKDKPWWMD